MATQEQLSELLTTWTADSDRFRAEARRLELSDLSRHATSIAMLEAQAQAIERCITQIGLLSSI
ncbi:hypothetical protein [Granulicella arctica]|uniref:hypothetical protein n=1 Tax=Granulicella arctica TaxID=940613 RepID=UPI0021E05B1E|nr:hypothetical protein [Granulicella arctica]